MKSVLKTTLALAIGSALAVLGLFFLTSRLNHQHNAFTRLFPPHPAYLEKTIDLHYNTFYLAGVTNSRIYLGNEMAPFRMRVFRKPFQDDSVTDLFINPDSVVRWTSPTVTVDSPAFYLLDGVLPGIFRGNFDDLKIHRLPHRAGYFTEAVLASGESFVFRSVSKSTHYMLGVSTNSPPWIRFDTTLLTKQVDGLFCTDGILQYDRELNRLVYLYYYRNQFLVMDTSLSLLYRGRTIDTNSVAKIKAKWTGSRTTATLASPPLIVNKTGSVYDNYLFVNSSLVANNEDEKLFRKWPVIDVYRLTDGVYQFSFYLPGDQGRKLKSFQVHRNQLFALYDHYLLIYSLAPKYFKK